MTMINEDEAFEYLAQHYSVELVEWVCEAFPDEVREYMREDGQE